ncbi:hypothetical protein [Caryophanon tenue]|uniref:Uncharacterized protein n=1 Tax=Caryophanon tenue TaxID=33978 RepID=A0A1C0Y509_9BACL|nr:hypothetical protein [Caryophanon tenue]OCS82268.1 hypothetical protein A6M13_07480 [Caryophanon tenue]
MKSDVKYAVAYVVARSFENNSTSKLAYSHAEGAYHLFLGEVDSTNIKVYDYNAQCYFSGAVTNGIAKLYHYGVSSYVEINFNYVDNSFKGYDYNSNNHFSGNFNGNSVALYDNETSGYYHFSVQ